MKSFKLFLMSVAVVLFAANACNKETTDDSGNGGTGTDGGETATPEIVVDVVDSEVSVSYEGGQTTVSYSVTNAVEGETLSAAVEESATWLEAEVGDETITLTVEANDTGESRSASVTLSYPGASDVELSVVQQSAYMSYIGTWTGTDVNGTAVSIQISEDVEGESYTISGWQFSGEYSDFSEFGFNEGGSLDFTAAYDSENKVLNFTSYCFGDYTVDSYSGRIWITGRFYISTGLEGAWIPAYGGPTLNIATMSMTDENNAEIVVSENANLDYIAMQYCFAIQDALELRTYLPTDLGGIYFPITLTKVSE